MSTHIEVNVADAVATVTLCRPEVYNAISFDMWDELVRHLLVLGNREDVHCIVLAAKGKHFSSGSDISDLQTQSRLSPGERAAFFTRQMGLVNRTFEIIQRLEQPVVSSVRGIAAGGGLGLAVGGDLVVASETASFSVAIVALGSIPDCGVPSQFYMSMGVKRAKQFCLMGETLSAARAEEYGLVNYVVADDHLESKTMEVAAHLASMPRPAINLAKSAVDRAAHTSLVEMLRQEPFDVAACVSQPAYVEQVDLFLAQRAARKRPLHSTGPNTDRPSA